MKRKAVEPPLKHGATVRVKAGEREAMTDQKLYLRGFTGEIMVKLAEDGRALLWLHHDDGRKPHFHPVAGGWSVT